MAWDVSVVKKTVYGADRVVILSCVADAATFNVVTGLDIIDYFSTGKMSATAGTNQAMYANSSATGVDTKGTIGCSGFTSGDELFISVYGR